MRKVIIAVALAALPMSGAFAATSGTHTEKNAAQSISFTAATGGTEFVVEDFTFNLSAGVGLQYLQDTVAMGVSTASGKGNYAYSGLSNGGAVTTCGAKAAAGAKPATSAPVLANTSGCASAASGSGS